MSGDGGGAKEEPAPRGGYGPGKRHPGRGGYGHEAKTEARAMWIQGKTDVEIAEHLGMGEIQGKVTVGDWRRNAEPDGQDWYVFRRQTTVLALERAREELSTDLAASIVSDVRTMHDVGRQLLNWLVWEINDLILGPLGRGEEPKMRLESPKDLRMVQAIICDILKQTDDLAQPRAPRTMDAEQLGAVADRLMKGMMEDASPEEAAVKVLEITRVALSALPPSGGNGEEGEIVETHEREE